MGTAKLNIWFRNSECEPLRDCWRTDLVIQTCKGTPLQDFYPEILSQLEQRYGNQGYAICTSSFPLTLDQTGKTLTVQVGTSAAENVVFTNPAINQTEIVAQMKAALTNVFVDVEGGVIKITSKRYGPDATINISGDSDLVWTITNGSGYKIVSHYYQNAWRIMLYPGGGKTINHVEADVPPGCYKIWTRVCHGNNEETSVEMINVKCGDHACVNLMLPTIKTCAAHIVHPLMDQVVQQQFLLDDAERVLVFRALLWGAGMGREQAIEALNYRLLEAQEKGDTDLEAKVNAVLALAQLLPACY